MHLGITLDLSSGSRGGFTPANLFASGAMGAYYDPSDASTVWQDTAGTVPAVAGQGVARIDRKAGTHDPLVQASASLRPVWTAAGRLSFDATDDTLSTTANQTLTDSDEVTVMVALNFRSAKSGAHLISHGGDFSGTYDLKRGSIGNESALQFYTRGSLVPTPASASPYTGAQSLVVGGRGKILTNLSELWINGALIATGSGNQGSGTFSNRPTIVGRILDSSLDADVAGILVINRLLTNDEMVATSAYMAGKL